MAKLGVVNLQTKNLWVEISGESPMDPGIPPLEMKNLLESKPRTSRFLVYGLAVQWSLSFFATILSLHLYLCILYIAFCSSYAFCTLYLMYRVSGSLHQILYFVHLSLWWFFLFRFWLWHSEPAWVTIQILSSWTDHISCTDCTIISLTAFQQFTNELVIACLKREVFCFFQVKLWDVGCWNDCRTTLWELTVSLLSISLPAGGEGCSSNIYIYIYTHVYITTNKGAGCSSAPSCSSRSPGTCSCPCRPRTRRIRVSYESGGISQAPLLKREGPI